MKFEKFGVFDFGNLFKFQEKSHNEKKIHRFKKKKYFISLIGLLQNNKASTSLKGFCMTKSIGIGQSTPQVLEVGPHSRS